MENINNKTNIVDNKNKAWKALFKALPEKFVNDCFESNAF